ncbi:MAG: SIS domain-containing protein [Limnohabitans sp.]
MLDLRIQQHFIDSADLHYQLAESLAKPLDAAVQAVLASVTGGGRIFTLGSQAAALQARYLAHLLVAGFERERPGLPALALEAEGAGPAAVPLVRQLEALGQAGDVLFVISAAAPEEAQLAAVEAAHERDMTVIALTAGLSSEWARRLRETDVHISVAHERVARVREVHHLALHCLCDAIDTQLLGEQEPL